MDYKKIANTSISEVYRRHYLDINGGIDGYYEKTILDAEIYEVFDDSTLAYFSIHCDRGLTSLVVLKEYKNVYEEIFDYVLKLPIVEKILFTENDINFLNSVKMNNIEYEIQAYNFSVNKKVESSFGMKRVDKSNSIRIKQCFSDFIEYNHIDLEFIESFYFSKGKEVISFGAIEPLRLNCDRFCISMIVNEKYRRRGYGSETVKFLINHLQRNNKKVNARCYVKNETSRKTLLRSGMIVSNYLYKAISLR